MQHSQKVSSGSGFWWFVAALLLPMPSATVISGMHHTLPVSISLSVWAFLMFMGIVLFGLMLPQHQSNPEHMPFIAVGLGSGFFFGALAGVACTFKGGIFFGLVVHTSTMVLCTFTFLVYGTMCSIGRLLERLSWE